MLKGIAIAIWIVGCLGSIIISFDQIFLGVVVAVGVFIQGALFWGFGQVVEILGSIHNRLYSVESAIKYKPQSSSINSTNTTDKMSTIQRTVPGAKSWRCKKCGQENSMSILSCKNCGEYK